MWATNFYNSFFKKKIVVHEPLAIKNSFRTYVWSKVDSYFSVILTPIISKEVVFNQLQKNCITRRSDIATLNKPLIWKKSKKCSLRQYGIEPATSWFLVKTADLYNDRDYFWTEIHSKCPFYCSVHLLHLSCSAFKKCTQPEKHFYLVWWTLNNKRDLRKSLGLWPIKAFSIIYG